VVINVSDEPTASIFRIYNPEDQKYSLMGFFLFFSLGETESTCYQPHMIDDDDCGEIGGMRIGRGNLSTWKKCAAVHFVHHKSHMT
jgi:hypothetical protein